VIRGHADDFRPDRPDREQKHRSKDDRESGVQEEQFLPDPHRSQEPGSGL